MAERFTVRHVHAVTGTFVLAVAVVIIAVVVLAGHSQRWFRNNVTLKIVMPASGAAGIRPDSEVYFLGTLVGNVSDVTVDPTGRMEAQVTIRRDFFRFVSTDSWAVVNKKFGVGDAYFEITRGRGRQMPVEDASIVCREPVPSKLEVAVEDIRQQALPMLKKFSAGVETWSVLGSNLITTRERLDRLIARADDITTGLQQGKGTAGELLNDSTVSDELKSVLKDANRSMHDLQVTLKTLQDASVNIQVASTNLPAISMAMRDEADDLPGLVLQTQISMRELERLIEAAQASWFFRRHINKTNPPPVVARPEYQPPARRPGRTK